MEVGGEGEKGEELDKEEIGGEGEGEEEFETEDMGREWERREVGTKGRWREEEGMGSQARGVGGHTGEEVGRQRKE